MSVRSWSYPVVLTLAAVFGAAATDAQAAGDAAHGKTLGYTCLGCHGVENYKNAYPNYSVPKLSGQHPEYIVQALKEYKSGERGHATMHAHAASLSDQDMEDIAAYFSGVPIKSSAGATGAGDAPAAVNTCQACHGRDGVGIMGTYPTLSGQHGDYIERALNEYRSGGRRNGIMGPFASQLKPEEIKAVARYFSKQKPALQTLDRPQFALSASAK
jgi:cytochrome c553